MLNVTSRKKGGDKGIQVVAGGLRSILVLRVAGFPALFSEIFKTMAWKWGNE